MDDLECKNKILEEKVCVLEDILYASKCMQLSEQKKAYIQNRTKVLRIIDLLINECAFAGTSLQTMIFPKGLKRLSGAVFTPESRFAFNCNNNKYYVVEKNKNTQEIACIFLGLDTKIVSDTFDGVSLIYCLPGSKVQRFAREHSIPVKPLSEFKMEDYT